MHLEDLIKVCGEIAVLKRALMYRGATDWQYDHFVAWAVNLPDTGVDWHQSGRRHRTAGCHNCRGWSPAWLLGDSVSRGRRKKRVFFCLDVDTLNAMGDNLAVLRTICDQELSHPLMDTVLLEVLTHLLQIQVHYGLRSTVRRNLSTWMSGGMVGRDTLEWYGGCATTLRLWGIGQPWLM